MTWAVLAIGLCLTVFGATAGAALVAISRVELTRAASRQLRGAAGALTRLGRLDTLLAAASTTTAFGVVILGAALPAAFSGSRWWLLALIGMFIAVPLVLFGGYLFPRRVTQPRAQAVAGYVIPILEVWAGVLRWLLPVRRGGRAHELRSLWREGAAVGLDVESDLQMVGGVMTFTERPAREAMTPRTDIVAVEEGASLEDITQLFNQSGYTRIPIYRGTLDDVIGMLHAFDLFKLAPGEPLPIRPVAVAPASRSCVDLLLDMQRERRHLAVVLDEFGGTLGIATLEDLLEELVGEIFDEHDEQQGTADAAGAEAMLLETDGSTPLSTLEERFGVSLAGARSKTIGGLLTELAGRIPRPGERFVIHDLEFDVLEATPARLERVLIRPGPVRAVRLLKETQ
ncbi:MAG: HlyC/CorC family transporter [Gemmatimonadales bacterium]|nr:HlyC/CorC family transporter [Gemmatimonadales bacterium]